MRTVLGVIFALFILCFVAIIIEETFLGGRRRRKAEKEARNRSIEVSTDVPATEVHAPQSSNTPHHPQ
jgi:hypothetical protein